MPFEVIEELLIKKISISLIKANKGEHQVLQIF